jgi:Tfp pilus assembly protein PilN
MKYSINLLAEKEAPFLERVMYFSLNYLRYIIIITQLIVIGVFFYRFQIDQRIIDLKESVDQKKEIVQVILPLSKEAEKINIQTREVKKILQQQEKFNSMTNYFLSVFPAALTLTNLEINPDSFKLTGNTIDPRQLQSFYSFLKKEGKFNNVELQGLKKSENGYIFILILSKFKQQI